MVGRIKDFYTYKTTDFCPNKGGDPNGTVVYFAGTFGKTISSFRFVEYFTIMENVCDCLSLQYVSIENSKSIEIFLRKKGNTFFLYLII